MIANDNSDRPSTFHILTDYYKHLISYYAGNPTLIDSFFLYQYSDTLITIFDILNKKVFKGGLELIPLNDNPNKEEESMLNDFIDSANENGEPLVEVLKQVEIGANWSNLRTTLILKEYVVKDGVPETMAIKEILHIDPLTLEPMKDKKGRLGHWIDGTKMFFSLKNRNQWVEEKEVKDKLYLSADYRINTNEGYTYYNRNELVVSKKFPANPIFALKNKILALIEQDKYIANEYSEGKPTKKLMLFKGRDSEELEGSLLNYSNAIKENPNKQQIITIGGVENNQNVVEVVDLVKSMEEMQLTDMRNEFRNAIGAPYGIAPVYQNDNKKGGLSSDSMDIEVTNESIEANKDYYNQLLKFIFNKTLGITDWEVKTKSNEEEDEAKIEDLLSKKLANAEKILKLGGKAKFIAEENTVLLEDTELEAPTFEPMNQNNDSNMEENNNKQETNLETKKEFKGKIKEMPEKTATDLVMDEFEKEYNNMVNNAINKIIK